MASDWLGLVELLLVFGAVLAFAVVELLSLREPKRPAKPPQPGGHSRDPPP